VRAEHDLHDEPTPWAKSVDEVTHARIAFRGEQDLFGCFRSLVASRERTPPLGERSISPETGGRRDGIEQTLSVRDARPVIGRQRARAYQDQVGGDVGIDASDELGIGARRRRGHAEPAQERRAASEEEGIVEEERLKRG
jgi:hypothetical protein